MLPKISSLTAIATTADSAQVLLPLTSALGIDLWIPANFNFPKAKSFNGSLREHLQQIWSEYSGFIFAISTGAVVRLIAPLLKDKSCDPAVLVVDANGQYVISLLSGHQGYADILTRLIAIELNAQPVITGISNSLNLPALDTLGDCWGWQKGSGDWNAVSAALAKGQTVEVMQENGSKFWQKNLSSEHSFVFVSTTSALARVYISARVKDISADLPSVQWHPRVLWIGIGTSRGVSSILVQSAVEQTLKNYNFSFLSIAAVVSVDLKSDEIGLREFCQTHNFPFLTYCPKDLENIEVPNPSEIVRMEVGTPSVAEASAIKAGQNLVVPKQIFQDDSGWVTVAIACSEIEHIGNVGSLLLVGTGPGNLGQMTSAAKRALIEADVIIGYSLYLELIDALKRPGQIIESYPITQEKQRAIRAIELAQWGLKVAVVSSGDAGIYGMAGLVFELLEQANWDGLSPKVDVFPGISALQSAASRLGAPLMHDFCAVSLSDLLTPWTIIETRLEAVASSDFVIALYNPRSQNRQQPLLKAWEILLKYRDSATPVGIVKSAYRDDEQIILTNLAQMMEQPIDMLTTVIVGNQSTSVHQQWLITPRGYLAK
jgi:cobalt-precorrin 5A hydrolase/precorrin-3B C17-methyltransferase